MNLVTPVSGKLSVGVSDLKISSGGVEQIVTHALGSCLGVTVYDPVTKVGGMLHAMLPNSSVDSAKAEKNPYIFVDTGIPQLFRQAYAAGAKKERIVVKVAGGASTRGANDLFKIGKRNITMLKKLLWKNGISISAESVGGDMSRTMYLYLATGETTLLIHGKDVPL